MTQSVRLEYPWPPAALNPNNGGNWGSKIAPKRKSKNDGYFVTMAAMKRLKEIAGHPDLEMVAEFYPPRRSGPAPDTDNTIASCKALQDGIALALGINDQEMIQWPPRNAERVPHGKIIIEFRPKRETVQ